MKIGNTADKAGILSLKFITTATTLGSVSLASIGYAYPDIPYTTISYFTTIPSLFCMPASILSGYIAGKQMKYKTVAILSVLMTMFAGVLPVLLGDNFTLILATRIVFGLGFGLVMPMGSVLISKLFNKNEQASMNGYNQIAQSISGLIYTWIGGLLSAIDIRYLYLAHIILAVPFAVIIFCLPEPENEISSVENRQSKVHLPVGAYIKLIWYIILLLFAVPITLNITLIARMHGMNAAQSSAAYMSYTIGGIVGGLTFGLLYKYCKKFSGVAALLVGAVGMFIASEANAFWPLCIGNFLSALLMSWLYPVIVMDITEKNLPETASVLIGLFYAVGGLAYFLASPLMQVITWLSNNNDPAYPVLICSIASVLLAIAEVGMHMRKS